MNKGQAVAVFLAGAAAGVGGKQVLSTVTVPEAVAKPSRPYVHAADLRREVASSDAGTPAVRFVVYGTEGRDLGQAKQCAAKPATQKKAADLLTALSTDCEW